MHLNTSNLSELNVYKQTLNRYKLSLLGCKLDVKYTFLTVLML